MSRLAILLIILSTLLFACTKSKESVIEQTVAVESENSGNVLHPEIQRFSWPEYLEWEALMDKYYDTDVSGITDTVLLNDLAVYDPVDMGWGDSNYIDSVFASSVLGSQGKTNYVPKNACDYKTTAWIEGVDGAGEGESLSVRFGKINKDEPLTSITIYSGFQASESTFTKNSRPKLIQVYVNDVIAYNLALVDTMKGQKFKVRIQAQNDLPVFIRFEIREVYRGTNYTDTGITEIQFDGEWGGI